MSDIERMKANPSAVIRRLESFVPQLGSEALRVIAGQCEWRGFYSSGTEIIRQGGPADAMYFIDHGSVEVTRDIQYGTLAVTQHVTNLYVGDVFGEMALVNNQPRNANVVALTDVAVFCLQSGNWRALRATFPNLGLVFDQIAANRSIDLASS